MSDGDKEAPRQEQDKDRGEARYWSGGHTKVSSKHRLRYHLVFVPKYRKRVLTGASRLEELLRQACEVNGWGLRGLAVQDDHVHLLVQLDPGESVSGVVKALKGGTSRTLRSELPEPEEFLWGGQLLGAGLLLIFASPGRWARWRRDGARLHPGAAALASTRIGAFGDWWRVYTVRGCTLKCAVIHRTPTAASVRRVIGYQVHGCVCR